MNENGKQHGNVLNPALLRLLALAGRIFSDCTPWLLLKNEGLQSHLVNENGLREPPAALSEFILKVRSGEAVVGDFSNVWRGASEGTDCCLLAAIAVADEQQTYGTLLLVGEKLRELSPAERDALKDVARQAALILERDQIAVALEGAVAAERDARELLIETRRDLRLVTDQVLEVLCKTDLTGTIWLINPSAERELGYGQGELIGRNVFDLVHPDERNRVEEAFREAASTGRFDTEIRCQHSEGHWVHLVCAGAALRDDDLVPNGYVVAGRNISRRKKAEADLRRLETRFKLVWDNSRDAMRLIDESGFILQVNDAYCRLVNKSPQELVGKPFLVAYTHADPEKTIRKFREDFARRSIPARSEVALRLWNGTERVFDRSSSFIEVEEQTLLLTTYRDITKRREEEAELKRLNDALRQRAAHLGALTLRLTRVEQEERRRLAQILHDHLQQLLVVARMTAERVRRRLPAGEDAETAAEVEHLLDESIEASRSITVELSPPVLHDGGLMAALEWLVRRVREKHGLNVSLTTDDDAEPPSIALRLFLFQAVRELLFNCYKHAGVSDVVLLVRPAEGKRVQIVVEDEGAGFDSSNVQLGAGSSRDCFGLFSLGERTDHIGGTMEIKSAPGKGTRVTLTVPLEPQVTLPSDEETLSVRHSSESVEIGDRKERGGLQPREKITLLLVDDHKIMRQGLCELFREEPDMQVVGEAENGLDGVSLAQRLQPDVVVMDITMPVMNGVEATRVLSSEFPEIKVIGLSMHMKEDMAKAMLEAGACAYVTKATASETLTETIRDCVRKSSEQEISEKRELSGLKE